LTEGLFDYNLWGLFLASFLAATVVPFSSEALLTFLIVNGTDAYTAVLVATAGNWLGGMSSYAIGYLGKWEWIEKYLRIKRETIEKWHNRLYKRGAIFAFLCWVPGVGDIFAVGLGLLRANIPITAIAMLADRAGILIKESGYFFRKDRIFQKMIPRSKGIPTASACSKNNRFVFPRIA
jgi:membrane protein YqaA with SNARE-associated domain